ncbi:MAG: hypothetical protein JJE28_07575 [Actinomycetales bacterium]|nr:hypothetical protein [Actinomycetales bacterium]
MNVEVEAAVAGARVLWVAPRMDNVRAALNSHADLFPDEVSRITRANGDERIAYKSGGKIRYVSSRGRGGRGYTAHMISISPADYANDDLLCTLLPCLATSADSRIVIRTSGPDA